MGKSVTPDATCCFLQICLTLSSDKKKEQAHWKPQACHWKVLWFLSKSLKLYQRTPKPPGKTSSSVRHRNRRIRAEALQLSLVSAPFWDKRSAVTQLSFSRQTSHPSPSFSHFTSKISTSAYLVHLQCHYLHLSHRWLSSQEWKKIPKWREAVLPSLTALQLPHGSPYSGVHGAPCHPLSARQTASQPPVFMVGPPPHCWWHCFYSTTLLRRKTNPTTSTLQPAADVPLPAGQGMHLSLAPNHLSSLVPLAASNEPYRYQPQWITPDSQKEPFSSASMPLHTVSSQSMLL